MQEIACDRIKAGMNSKASCNVVLDRQAEVAHARMVTYGALCLEPVGQVLTVLLSPRLKEFISTKCDPNV
jgi:hypothetical protein